MATATATKARPVHETRIGSIKAAIWVNETKNGPRHNVTFSRLYRDDDGNWRDSTSFGRDDLLVLARVAGKAYDWIFEQGSANNDS